jgi:membrane dipeptidase
MTDWKQVHAEAIVIDTHSDTPQRFVDEAWNFCGALDGGMLNLETALQGNLAAEFFAIWVQPEEWRGRYAFRTLQLIDGVYEQLKRRPKEMRLGLSPEDIVAAHAEGVFCALMGIEGGHSIEADLGLLRLYHRLGVRYMTLTWANSNEWADSSGDLDDASVAHHGGLTEFGREVVREMNRMGMMVDVSHVSDATFWDVMKTTRVPVIASHSCAWALTNAARNLTDEQLRAVAEGGGAVMVNFYPSFIDETWRAAWKATEARRDALYAEAVRPYRERGEAAPYRVQMDSDRKFFAEEFAGAELPGVEAIVEHIDYVGRVAGIEHVGIGSDFDGFSLGARGMESAAGLPLITEGLVARGYSAEQVKLVLGGNLLRVFGAVLSGAQ